MSDVTVLMTVYNGMPYLPAAVESIFAQTHWDFKFIIVNDGSTDGTVDYLASLTDPRVLVLHQHNQGTAVAANHGLAHCDTEFMARLDSDDLAAPTRLAEQPRFLRANPDVGLVGSQVLPLGRNRAGASLVHPTDHDTIIEALLATRHAIVNSSIMCRTALAQQLGGYWTLPAGEDYDLFMRMADHAKLANLDQILLQFRVHALSLNGSGLRRVRFCIDYACESARRRRANLPAITPEQFQTQLDARPWWCRAADNVDIHARAQYRVALTELYGGQRVRGTVRMAWAALCSPKLTAERCFRVAALFARRALGRRSAPTS